MQSGFKTKRKGVQTLCIISLNRACQYSGQNSKAESLLARGIPRALFFHLQGAFAGFIKVIAQRGTGQNLQDVRSNTLVEAWHSIHLQQQPRYLHPRLSYISYRKAYIWT